MTPGAPLCYYHTEAAEQRQAAATAQAAQEATRATLVVRLLPKKDGLNSAADVRRFLSRVTRAAADGSLRPRDANSLGYLGQVLLTTIAQRDEEAVTRAEERAKARQHPILGQYVEFVKRFEAMLADHERTEEDREALARGTHWQPPENAENRADEVESASTDSSEPDSGGSENDS